MPELPEVETVRRGLAPVLEGRVLARVEQRRPNLRWPFPNDFAHRLEGRRIKRLGRRSKYLLVYLDDGTVLIVHLGMSGRFRIHAGPPPAPERHDHVIFTTDDGTTVCYNDPRRFGLMALTDEADMNRHTLLAGIGPEPLDGLLDGPFLANRLKGRKAPIKAALMDQGVIAGLGNIYVCESLFRSGISPKRTAATVQGKRAERLATAIRDVLEEAIESGGSTLRDHRQPDGELGYFQHAFTVYGREGEACPGCDCDLAKTGGVQRMTQSGRSTFYCPRRQR